jgi:exonuclease III
MHDQLIIATLNCNGLNKVAKIFYLRDILMNNKIDVCFLQETHFDNEEIIVKFENNFKDYFLFSNMTENKTKGVAILIRKSINNLSIENFNFYEERVLAIDIKMNNNLFNLVNVYAPNLCKEQLSFIETLTNFIHKKKNLILGGDFNYV